MQTTAKQANTEMGRQDKPHRLLAGTGAAPGTTQERLRAGLAHIDCGMTSGRAGHRAWLREEMAAGAAPVQPEVLTATSSGARTQPPPSRRQGSVAGTWDAHTQK